MRWSEVKWSEVKWGWGEVRMRWGDVKWSDRSARQPTIPQAMLVWCDEDGIDIDIDIDTDTDTDANTKVHSFAVSWLLGLWLQ